MGRLLRTESCKVCNYNVEDVLLHGNSTRTGLFIYHRYLLGHCPDCANIVSVLTRTPDFDVKQVLAAAERDIATLQERAAKGNAIAMRLLTLHQFALETDPAEVDPAVDECTFCGGNNVTVFEHVGGDDGEHFEDGTAWLDCPSCEDGRVWIRGVGWWDEIDSGL